jgi:hypothetical protein
MHPAGGFNHDPLLKRTDRVIIVGSYGHVASCWCHPPLQRVTSAVLTCASRECSATQETSRDSSIIWTTWRPTGYYSGSQCFVGEGAGALRGR